MSSSDGKSTFEAREGERARRASQLNAELDVLQKCVSAAKTSAERKAARKALKEKAREILALADESSSGSDDNDDDVRDASSIQPALTGPAAQAIAETPKHSSGSPKVATGSPAGLNSVGQTPVRMKWEQRPEHLRVDPHASPDSRLNESHTPGGLPSSTRSGGLGAVRLHASPIPAGPPRNIAHTRASLKGFSGSAGTPRGSSIGTPRARGASFGLTPRASAVGSVAEGKRLNYSPPAEEPLTPKAERAPVFNSFIKLTARGVGFERTSTFRSDPFMELYKLNRHIWEKIATTDAVAFEACPDFPTLMVNVHMLCFGTYDRPLKFRFLERNGDHKTTFVGEFVTTADVLLSTAEAYNPASLATLDSVQRAEAKSVLRFGLKTTQGPEGGEALPSPHLGAASKTKSNTFTPKTGQQNTRSSSDASKGQSTSGRAKYVFKDRDSNGRQGPPPPPPPPPAPDAPDDAPPAFDMNDAESGGEESAPSADVTRSGDEDTDWEPDAPEELPVPKGWRLVEKPGKRPFWWHDQTEQSQWTRPLPDKVDDEAWEPEAPADPPLPEGWEYVENPGRTPFYWHAATEQSQWDRPMALPSSAEAQQPGAASSTAVELKPGSADATLSKEPKSSFESEDDGDRSHSDSSSDDDDDENGAHSDDSDDSDDSVDYNGSASESNGGHPARGVIRMHSAGTDKSKRTALASLKSTSLRVYFSDGTHVTVRCDAGTNARTVCQRVVNKLNRLAPNLQSPGGSVSRVLSSTKGGVTPKHGGHRFELHTCDSNPNPKVGSKAAELMGGAPRKWVPASLGIIPPTSCPLHLPDDTNFLCVPSDEGGALALSGLAFSKDAPFASTMRLALREGYVRLRKEGKERWKVLYCVLRSNTLMFYPTAKSLRTSPTYELELRPNSHLTKTVKVEDLLGNRTKDLLPAQKTEDLMMDDDPTGLRVLYNSVFWHAFQCSTPDGEQVHIGALTRDQADMWIDAIRTRVDRLQALERVHHAGYVGKKMKYRHNWETRYLVLKEQALVWYKRAGDKEPLGTMRLTGSTKVSAAAKGSTTGNLNQTPNSQRPRPPRSSRRSTAGMSQLDATEEGSEKDNASNSSAGNSRKNSSSHDVEFVEKSMEKELPAPSSPPRPKRSRHRRTNSDGSPAPVLRKISSSILDLPGNRNMLDKRKTSPTPRSRRSHRRTQSQVPMSSLASFSQSLTQGDLGPDPLRRPPSGPMPKRRTASNASQSGGPEFFYFMVQRAKPGKAPYVFRCETKRSMQGWVAALNARCEHLPKASVEEQLPDFPYVELVDLQLYVRTTASYIKDGKTRHKATKGKVKLAMHTDLAFSSNPLWQAEQQEKADKDKGPIEHCWEDDDVMGWDCEDLIAEAKQGQEEEKKEADDVTPQPGHPPPVSSEVNIEGTLLCVTMRAEQLEAQGVGVQGTASYVEMHTTEMEGENLMGPSPPKRPNSALVPETPRVVVSHSRKSSDPLRVDTAKSRAEQLQQKEKDKMLSPLVESPFTGRSARLRAKSRATARWGMVQVLVKSKRAGTVVEFGTGSLDIREKARLGWYALQQSVTSGDWRALPAYYIPPGETALPPVPAAREPSSSTAPSAFVEDADDDAKSGRHRRSNSKLFGRLFGGKKKKGSDAKTGKKTRKKSKASDAGLATGRFDGEVEAVRVLFEHNDKKETVLIGEAATPTDLLTVLKNKHPDNVQGPVDDWALYVRDEAKQGDGRDKRVEHAEHVLQVQSLMASGCGFVAKRVKGGGAKHRDSVVEVSGGVRALRVYFSDGSHASVRLAPRDMVGTVLQKVADKLKFVQNPELQNVPAERLCLSVIFKGEYPKQIKDESQVLADILAKGDTPKVTCKALTADEAAAAAITAARAAAAAKSRILDNSVGADSKRDSTGGNRWSRRGSVSRTGSENGSESESKGGVMQPGQQRRNRRGSLARMSDALRSVVGRPAIGRAQSKWRRRCKSKVVHNSLNPCYRTFFTDMSVMCAGDVLRPVLMKVQSPNVAGATSIGHHVTNLLRIMTSHRRMALTAKGSRDPGSLTDNRMVVATDFTGWLCARKVEVFTPQRTVRAIEERPVELLRLGITDRLKDIKQELKELSAGYKTAGHYISVHRLKKRQTALKRRLASLPCCPVRPDDMGDMASNSAFLDKKNRWVPGSAIKQKEVEKKKKKKGKDGHAQVSPSKSRRDVFGKRKKDKKKKDKKGKTPRKKKASKRR